jgi:alpha-beta hydrolase superfamily lysophospholipase
MHPHVAQKLFWDNGFDLYVLNYKMNGHCRKQGWVKDAHYNSHNKYGDFNVYNNDISQALDIISAYRAYDELLGYAHSTGGPILLNYIMEHGDDAFAAFVFNSPFMDWGFVGGDMIEFVLEHVGLLNKLHVVRNDKKIDDFLYKTPSALEKTPIHYLGQDVVLSDWSARIWSMYYFDWSTRPLYGVPVTVGFAQGVTGVHRKLQERNAQNRAITSKPFLVITAQGDDVLKSDETLTRADWIGPCRTEMELNDNGHDVFLSGDHHDSEMAIELVAVWLQNKNFL